ncbi:hypothetical protein CFOL_v3_23045 [Cephalotus follicularis]|uniref:Uncharacterized protein n=1 Tax=Cephalotus follicularis TaxID=3775 RepID=A0A1Q3CH51_CEPFO|nr:hypothetical protein CFOL_v3_23045 [Cephalotus follicularis]
MAMEVQIPRDSIIEIDEDRFKEFIAEGSLEFDEWTSLISEIESSNPDDLEKICLVYDSFLSEFPLCHGYWRKYADHKARLCTIDKVVEVFERAVQSATYSVGLWVDYCSFSMLVFEDPNDVRRLFKRGISFVGKDYLCDTLWDKYIEFEFSQQQWGSLVHIYIQTLRFPTKKLHGYYDCFKKLAATWKEEMDSQSDSTMDIQSEAMLESEVPSCCKKDEIASVIKDLLNPSTGLVGSKALQKYLYIGEQYYREACKLDEEICTFEPHIRRNYFHVEPLDGSQLENWHDYLNFAEMRVDFDWVVKLYERCLIPCAYYPEFWIRYVDFMESKGGREIANFALARATQIFLKKMPVVHFFNAKYKEQIGDVVGARTAFLQCDTESDFGFVENVILRANMEKRLGNFLAASEIFEEALEIAAAKNKLHALPMLYVHFSRLKYMTTDSADAARDILIDAIKRMPHCKLLLEELIHFVMMHGGPRHMNVVDPIIFNALSSGQGVSQGLGVKDLEDISILYLQFVDLCGTIDDVRRAWNRHIKLFPDSMRSPAFKLPDTHTKALKIAIKGRQEPCRPLPLQPSDGSPNHLIQSPFEDKKLPPMEKYDTQSDHADTDHVSDQKTMESIDIQSNWNTIDHLQSVEADKTVKQVFTESSLQPIKDAPEPNVSSHALVHPVNNENEEIHKSQEFVEGNDNHLEYNHECKQVLEPLSGERLSLDHQNANSPSSCNESQKCECQKISLGNRSSLNNQVPQETSVSDGSSLKTEVPQEISMSNESMLEYNPNTSGDCFVSRSMGTQASDSSQIQLGTDSPSSASYQNIITKEALSRPRTPVDDGSSWPRNSSFDKIRTDSKFRLRKHPHRKLQQQKVSSRHSYPLAATDAQIPISQGYSTHSLSPQNPKAQPGSQAQNNNSSSATHADLISPQAWSMQNIQQQYFGSGCQSQSPALQFAYPQAQMPPFPMQSNDQYGHMQYNQAYSQMWQYYYYQQQQPLLQQQQQLHLQPQPHQEQPPQQQYQQQQLELQQHHIQHQLLQLQQHQQFLHQQNQYNQQQCLLQQPPLLQLQPYEKQQLQPQPQHLLFLQPQPQHLQSQQQQQQLHQWLPQPKQQQQQQHEQEQRQGVQQTTCQVQAGNDAYKKDQGVSPPTDMVASGALETAVSPHPQPQSPQSE